MLQKYKNSVFNSYKLYFYLKYCHGIYVLTLYKFLYTENSYKNHNLSQNQIQTVEITLKSRGD